VDRDPHDSGVDGSQGTHEARAELRVMVADQHLRCLPVEGGVARLLSAPRVGGCVRHRGVNDRASPQVEKEKYEDLAKLGIVGLHEVRGPRDVVVQECRPALIVAAMTCGSPHIALDRTFAHADAELEQLPADPLGAPARIARGDLSDERGPHRGRSTQPPRASSPQRAKSCSVPAKERRWLNE
jgi:hypothetical protein